jgi:hypothetical protein
MKIVEALKLRKELLVKADDLRKKIGLSSAHLNIETPLYADQPRQVSEWLQAHESITQEIAALSLRVQKTNIATSVTIQIGGKSVAKVIAEWVLRRRELAKLDEAAWAQLTDRNLKEQNIQTSPGSPVTEIRIKRCFDAKVRDEKIALYRAEPSVIDRTLEVVNATTDLLD